MIVKAMIAPFATDVRPGGCDVARVIVVAAALVLLVFILVLVSVRRSNSLENRLPKLSFVFAEDFAVP